MRRTLTSAPRSRGFTFLEMVVAVAVLAIGAAVVLPNFQRVVFSQRVSACANELIAAFQMGRMEAVRRRTRVVACPSLNGTACAGTDWLRTIVFVDTDRNGDRASTEPVLRAVDFRDMGVRVTQTAGSTPARVVFTPSGFQRSGQSGGPLPALRVCSPRALERDSVVTVGLGSSAAAKGTGGPCNG